MSLCPSCILGISNQFHVAGTDAVTGETEMVNGKAVRYETDFMFVSPSVGSDRFASPEVPVPIAQSAVVKPTRAESGKVCWNWTVFVNDSPESLLFCTRTVMQWIAVTFESHVMERAKALVVGWLQTAFRLALRGLTPSLAAKDSAAQRVTMALPSFVVGRTPPTAKRWFEASLNGACRVLGLVLESSPSPHVVSPMQRLHSHYTR